MWFQEFQVTVVPDETYIDDACRQKRVSQGSAVVDCSVELCEEPMGTLISTAQYSTDKHKISLFSSLSKTIELTFLKCITQNIKP